MRHGYEGVAPSPEAALNLQSRKPHPACLGHICRIGQIYERWTGTVVNAREALKPTTRLRRRVRLFGTLPRLAIRTGSSRPPPREIVRFASASRSLTVFAISSSAASECNLISEVIRSDDPNRPSVTAAPSNVGQEEALFSVRSYRD